MVQAASNECFNLVVVLHILRETKSNLGLLGFIELEEIQFTKLPYGLGF